MFDSHGPRMNKWGMLRKTAQGEDDKRVADSQVTERSTQVNLSKVTQLILN